MRPILFLDVDGPLIPYAAPVGSSLPAGSAVPDEDPYLARMDRAHGPRLLALPCDLVWATMWMADANDAIAPRLGLPPLPVVIWPDPSAEDEQDERDGLHWKTRTLVAWAAGRPFVWVDDESTDIDRAWVAANHPGQALLRTIDPRFGLAEADFVALHDWLRAGA